MEFSKVWFTLGRLGWVVRFVQKDLKDKDLEFESFVF